jgi:hypothetical protein
MNPHIFDLARSASFGLTRRWHYDWAPYEEDLGFTFPSEYKEYVSYFPPGTHGGAIMPEHPAIKEGGLDFPGHIRLGAQMYAAYTDGAPEAMSFYPAKGGLIPWAQHESTAALCWRADGDDPDTWPVYAVSEAAKIEHLPGSTIEALLHLLRREAGLSVFPVTFYNALDRYGALTFRSAEDAAGDVELPEPEPIDPPAETE